MNRLGRLTVAGFLFSSILLVSACASKENRLKPTGVVEVERKAEGYYKQANLQLAEVEYRRLLKMVPQYAKGWFRLGNIYLRTSQLDAAIRHYEKAIAYDSKMAKAWHNLSLARIRQATNTLVEGQQHVESGHSAEIDLLLKKLLLLQRAE